MNHLDQESFVDSVTETENQVGPRRRWVDLAALVFLVMIALWLFIPMLIALWQLSKSHP